MVGLVIDLTFKSLLALAVSPFFVGYALLRIVCGMVRLLHRARAAKRLLGDSIPCGSCGWRNCPAGRWTCGNCKAEFHGFVGECSLCGAGCTAFPCERCGISIPLGF